MITVNCAKEIAMNSNSDMGKSVRKYFIEIENILDRYKNIVIEYLNSRIF